MAIQQHVSVCGVCVQLNTFQLVLATDQLRHVMIFQYGRLDGAGTVNSCDLSMYVCMYVCM